MARRSSQTFAKRQKEMARKEKQQRKAEKRMERKRLREQGLLPPSTDELVPLDGPVPLPEEDEVPEPVQEP
jgi:hypothetical protein